MPSLRHKRGTRAQIDAAATANGLRAGEIYLITDESRLTVGTAVNTHIPVAKQSEAAGGAPSDTLIVTPSADQSDYDPAGLSSAWQLGFNASASIVLSGLSGGSAGREMIISNRSTEFVLIIENQGTDSAATNRFDLPNGFPLFLMPGDRATFLYSSTSQRWQLVSASCNVSQMGLTEFTDFAGGTTGPFTLTVSGTGASGQVGTYGVNATERCMGVVQIDTGTVATNRATIGHAGTDSIVPKIGCALSVARLAAEALPSATETFQLISGFADSAGGTFTDGAAWNLRWNGAAAEWSMDRLSNAVATRDATGSPTPDTTYIWLAVFLNADWSRADYFYSTDSVNWIKAGSKTTGLPAVGRNTAWVAASIIKSVGTTQRNCSIDLAGNRVDYVRG